MRGFGKSLRFFVGLMLALTTSAVVFAQSTDASAPKPDEHSSASSKLHVFTNVSGTGTTGRIVKWTDTSGTLGDSIIAETAGGQIGIGSPASISNKLHVFTTTNADGLSVDGTQSPALILRNNGTIAGYLGLATAATSYFSNALSGDVALRSETGNVLLGRGGIAAALVVNGANVGIGTALPKANLHVYSDATADATLGLGPDPSYSGGTGGPALNIGYAGASFGRGAGFINVRPDASAVAPNPSLRVLTQNVERMIITKDGWVGIGTSNPGSTLLTGQDGRLDIQSAVDRNAFLVMQNTSNTTSANARIRAAADVANVDLVSHATVRTVSRWGVTLGGWNEVLSSAGNGLAVGTYYSVPLILGTNSTARMTISSTGAITIGSTAAPSNTVIHGSLTADSVIGAVYQDVAEWVPAKEKMSPGTVVVLDREHDNQVTPSALPYDTAVAGVVSAQPGVVLGVASEAKAQIATTGRVKVHVDATAGAIAIGDLLVTSDKAGTAMKSQPVDLGGVKFHRPGTVIGKALQPLPNGQGDILVLLSLQ